MFFVFVIAFSSPFYMYIKPQSDLKLVLDVRGAENRAGAQVILYADKGDLADNQLWYEDEHGVIRSKMNGFAIDASGDLDRFFDWLICSQLSLQLVCVAFDSQSNCKLQSLFFCLTVTYFVADKLKFLYQCGRAC